LLGLLLDSQGKGNEGNKKAPKTHLFINRVFHAFYARHGFAASAYADPPIANPDSASTLQDTPVTIDVLANDIDPTNTHLKVDPPSLTSPRHGSVGIQPIMILTPSSIRQNKAI